MTLPSRLRHAPYVLLGATVLLTGVGAGYAVAAKPVPVISTVCVSTTGARAVTIPVKATCAKGSSLRRLSSALPGRTGKTGPAGPTGATGPAGAAGARGATGAPGASGATHVQRVVHYYAAPPGSSASILAICPTGSTLTGGGFDVASTDPAINIYRSAPEVNASNVAIGWDVGVANSSTTTTIGITSTALCATP